MSNPRTASKREARRQEIRAFWLARAERQAAMMERSMVCGGFDGTVPPRHAGTEAGCRDDGNDCICECHDV